MSSGSINQVLRLLATSIKQKPSKFSIVSGNQSGDLDSVVSAITYAYFNHLQNASHLMIPLLNFTRKELSSRKDVLLVFQKHEIDSRNLFFSDDLMQLKNADQLILVDHNSPQGKLRELNLRIVGIVDHHEDEGIATDAEPRIIQRAGSCSSLVFNYWYDLLESPRSLDGSVIKFLLAPLVIDTSNLTSKVEDIDIKAFKIYGNYLNDFDTGAFYKDVKEAKDDIEGLSLPEIFLKDYKDFEFEVGSSDIVKKVGVTSIVKSFKWLEERFSTVNESSKSFIQNEGLDIFVLMTGYMDEENRFNRQLGVIGSTEGDELLISLVLEKLKEQLDLKPLPQFSKEAPKLQVFQQNNLAASRKQVVPAFKYALEAL